MEFEIDQSRFISALGLAQTVADKRSNNQPILANVLITSVVWHLLGRDMRDLREEVTKQFSHKGEAVVKQNLECIDAGIAFCTESIGALAVKLPPPDKKWSDALLVTGSQAMGLGLVHAGCR